MKSLAAVVRFVAVAAVMVAVLIPMTASTTVFPAEGTRGDAATELRCPRGYFLVGLKGRGGNWIDQLALICRRIDPPAYAAGAQTTTRAVGGSGGAPIEAYCAQGSAVRGIGVDFEREDWVDKGATMITFRCQRPRDGSPAGDVTFNRAYNMTIEEFNGVDGYNLHRFMQKCPGNEYATGLSVRYGRHVNAFGLICEDFSDPVNTAPPIGIQLDIRLKEPIGPGMEDDTNRVGSDYRRFELAEPNPAACQRACRDDSRTCRAWTYVRPNVQGPKPVCYLKTEEPRPGLDTCCISGVEKFIIIMRPPVSPTPPPISPLPPSPPPSTAQPSGGDSFEDNTDRPGMDIDRIELNTADPMRCRRRCNDRGECRAWTYVRPGVQGPRAVCYLKSAAPPPKPSNCCVSGVK